MRFSISRFQRLTDLDVYWPGFKALWKNVRQCCGTVQTVPTSVTFSDEPLELSPDEFDRSRRFTIDVATNNVSSEVPLKAGDWISQSPGSTIATCYWNDRLRTFSMIVETPPGTLTASPRSLQFS